MCEPFHTLKKSARIRVLNDNFRATFLGGQVVMSAGVAELPMGVRAQVVVKVQNFAEFNEGNDPFGEHDFGSFEAARRDLPASGKVCKSSSMGHGVRKRATNRNPTYGRAFGWSVRKSLKHLQLLLVAIGAPHNYEPGAERG